jgi:acyl carrier protein
MSTDVGQDIRSIVAEVLRIPEAEVRQGADLRGLPGMDSVKILRIVTRIERRHGIELEEDVVFNVETLADLEDLVCRTAAQSPHA